MPAITACLTDSLLDISIVMFGSKRCSATSPVIAARVPDPNSRTMNGCPCKVESGARSNAGKGCLGPQTNTRG